jgi:ribosome-binding factor A
MSERRIQRIGELVRTSLAEILQGMKDPRVQFVTVTRVEMAKDLRTAAVYFSVLGDEGTQRTALRGLEHARGRLQAELHRDLRLRHTPVLRFCHDPSLATSVRVAALIREAVQGPSSRVSPAAPEDAVESDEADEGTP